MGRAQRVGQLGAGGDLELLVPVRQVHLDGPNRYEQRLGDLSVAEALRGHARDAQLARGERVSAVQDRAAGPGARRGELLPRLLGQGLGAAALG
jgi:hypothetical protein